VKHRHTLTPIMEEEEAMSATVLSYYEAIEQASADMLNAARSGDWNQVVKLEGACVLLISQLKQAARELPLQQDQARMKSRIMQRILVNDAEVRHLAEPWLQDLHQVLQGKPSSTLH
jgi:flagellar protein FliT